MLIDLKELNLVTNRGIIDIDSNIVPTILLLNKHGYTTTNCCSGHPNQNRLYIQFTYSKRTLKLIKKLVNKLVDNNLCAKHDVANTYMLSTQKFGDKKTIYFGIDINYYCTKKFEDNFVVNSANRIVYTNKELYATLKSILEKDN